MKFDSSMLRVLLNARIHCSIGYVLVLICPLAIPEHSVVTLLGKTNYILDGFDDPFASSGANGIGTFGVATLCIGVDILIFMISL